jgi:hypothetical protein
MKRLQVQEQSVDGLAGYRVLNEEFSRYLMGAFRGKIYLIEPSPIISRQFPILDKLIWNPNRNFIFAPKAKGKMSISASEYFHEAIHQIFYRHYGKKSFHDATLCLLSEATASCVDIYFWLQLAARQNWSAERFFAFINISQVTTVQKKSVQRQLRLLRQDPGSEVDLFHSYEVSFFNLYIELESLFQQNYSSHPIKLKELEKLLSTMENSWIIKKYDFLNNIFFAKAYGTKNFSERRYQTLLKNARQSSSLPNYVQRLLKG